MFGAKRLTADDHRRQQVRQLHAPPIRQTAATTGADCRKTRETGRNTPPLPKMQENLQEKTFPCVLHTIMPTETIGTAAASCKIGAKMQDSSPRATPASCGGHRLPSIRGGWFTIGRPADVAIATCTLPPAQMFLNMFPKTFPKRSCPVKLRLCGVFLMPVGGGGLETEGRGVCGEVLVGV